MGYDLDGKDGRLTADEFEALTTAANILVWDGGKRGEMLRMFHNQINNECKRAGIDSGAVFAEIRDYFTPNAKQEFYSEHLMEKITLQFLKDMGQLDGYELQPITDYEQMAEVIKHAECTICLMATGLEPMIFKRGDSIRYFGLCSKCEEVTEFEDDSRDYGS